MVAERSRGRELPGAFALNHILSQLLPQIVTRLPLYLTLK
jgi:hypothetical protein